MSKRPKPLTLSEALGVASRFARFRAGVRECEWPINNSGPAAAAYVVEKVTGKRFEDYVHDNFFTPLYMDSASYFLTPAVQRNLTGLFAADGRTRMAYWHISVRPSGAINASPRDMANYVRFYLNRAAWMARPSDRRIHRAHGASKAPWRRAPGCARATD